MKVDYVHKDTTTDENIRKEFSDVIYPTMVIRSQAETIELQKNEIERLNNIIDTLKIEISSLMSRYFYEEDFYIEDTHLDKLLRIIDNDIELKGSDKE